MENQERKSERAKKRKKIFSPDTENESNIKKKKPGLAKKINLKTFPQRPYDMLPNGEAFSCAMCKSPYVVNLKSKIVKKTVRSRHVPLPKTRLDKLTGKEMMLCNACVHTYDRPKNRVVKQVKVPSQNEVDIYMNQADNLVASLREVYDNSLVERLYCPVSKKKLCGCLQKYITKVGVDNDTVKELLILTQEADKLSKEKSYIIQEQKKSSKRLIGLGNGHKKSRRFEEFVLNKRAILKDNFQLCERATQRILMYSNNFLHKRLKTENRPCRIERTRGKAALGTLPELHTLVDLHCCTDHCVMMALTHRKLLQDWRERARQGQMEARRVLAEMLTPAGAFHTNCYNFISMVTGCSLATIGRVFNQMIDSNGVRDPPVHGMKKVWQEIYKQNRNTTSSTSQKNTGATEDSPTSTSKPASTTSTQPGQMTSQVNPANVEIQTVIPEHLARQQQHQQQLLPLQLQLVASNTHTLPQNPAVLQQLVEQLSQSRIPVPIGNKTLEMVPLVQQPVMQSVGNQQVETYNIDPLRPRNIANKIHDKLQQQQLESQLAQEQTMHGVRHVMLTTPAGDFYLEVLQHDGDQTVNPSSIQLPVSVSQTENQAHYQLPVSLSPQAENQAHYQLPVSVSENRNHPPFSLPVPVSQTGDQSFLPVPVSISAAGNQPAFSLPVSISQTANHISFPVPVSIFTNTSSSASSSQRVVSKIESNDNVHASSSVNTVLPISQIRSQGQGVTSDHGQPSVSLNQSENIPAITSNHPIHLEVLHSNHISNDSIPITTTELQNQTSLSQVILRHGELLPLITASLPHQTSQQCSIVPTNVQVEQNSLPGSNDYTSPTFTLLPSNSVEKVEGQNQPCKITFQAVSQPVNVQEVKGCSQILPVVSVGNHLQKDLPVVELPMMTDGIVWTMDVQHLASHSVVADTNREREKQSYENQIVQSASNISSSVTSSQSSLSNTLKSSSSLILSENNIHTKNNSSQGARYYQTTALESCHGDRVRHKSEHVTRIKEVPKIKLRHKSCNFELNARKASPLADNSIKDTDINPGQKGGLKGKSSRRNMHVDRLMRKDERKGVRTPTAVVNYLNKKSVKLGGKSGAENKVTFHTSDALDVVADAEDINEHRTIDTENLPHRRQECRSRHASGSNHGDGEHHGSVRSRHPSESLFELISRSWKPSGNSQTGDRSRKSSGNSHFSEMSGVSLISSLSPNIFLDKEKGLFLLQSIEEGSILYETVDHMSLLAGQGSAGSLDEGAMGETGSQTDEDVGDQEEIFAKQRAAHVHDLGRMSEKVGRGVETESEARESFDRASEVKVQGSNPIYSIGHSGLLAGRGSSLAGRGSSHNTPVLKSILAQPPKFMVMK